MSSTTPICVLLRKTIFAPAEDVVGWVSLAVELVSGVGLEPSEPITYTSSRRLPPATQKAPRTPAASTASQPRRNVAPRMSVLAGWRAVRLHSTTPSGECQTI